MYFAASLFAALIVTLFVVSKIAKMLHAKRPEMVWVFLASLVGIVFAIISMVLLNLFAQGIDPMVMLIVSVTVVLIVSSVAFKAINQMNWSGAITTNIATVVIGLMTAVAAIVLNGESLNEKINDVTSLAKTNSAMMESVATGEVDVTSILDSGHSVSDEQQNEMAMEDAEELEPVITELDLLPPSAAKEIKAKTKRVYVEPKFHVISISSINSVVGSKIRIIKKNGNKITGSLKSIHGNDAVVSQRMSSGVATTPISIASIRKLEVYR
jgi:signal transduction histidine kinase